MSALVRRGAWRGGLTYVLSTGATMQTIDTLVTELAQAEQRIAALEAALRRWVEADGGGGLHLDTCAYSDGDPCDCGLDEARALLAHPRLGRRS